MSSDIEELSQAIQNFVSTNVVEAVVKVRPQIKHGTDELLTMDATPEVNQEYPPEGDREQNNQIPLKFLK